MSVKSNGAPTKISICVEFDTKTTEGVRMRKKTTKPNKNREQAMAEKGPSCVLSSMVGSIPQIPQYNFLPVT